jgi:hypothetical protein
LTDDNLKQLYSDLQRDYDLTIDRRKTLTGQATSLMSFAGIIQTILVGLLVTLATNSAARTLLSASPYYLAVVIIAGVGFFAYILTAFFSLLAFREPKWMRIPEMPDKDPLQSVEDFYSRPDSYNPKMFARQLVQATTFHQKTNDRKYNYLVFALVSLMTGIIFTAVGGVLLMATIL